MELKRRMGELWQRVLQPTADKIQAMLIQGESILAIAAEIEKALYIANTQYASVSSNIVAQWRLGVSDETRRLMQQGLRASLGVDMAFVMDGEPVRQAMIDAGEWASQLIKTIPADYLGRVARAVADNYAGRKLEHGTLTEELIHLGAHSRRKAQLMARDQTSKLTGALNQVRQESIGIDEYIWRTVQDQRVAGDPTGKYPDVNPKSTFHGDHYDRNGKRFKWNDPPPDGHPGQPGYCRCHAQPVIDPAKIIARAEGR